MSSSSSAATSAKLDEALASCGRLLALMMAHKEAGVFLAGAAGAAAFPRRPASTLRAPPPARLCPAPFLAGPFLEPVDWQTHGLKDYPKVIKHPMDLGTVATRLKMREYKHPKVRAGSRARARAAALRAEGAPSGPRDARARTARGDLRHPCCPPRILRARQEFKHDVNLVWNNCMTYNVEGSPYYLVAQKLKQIFEERYAKTVRDEGACVAEGEAAEWRQPRAAAAARAAAHARPTRLAIALRRADEAVEVSRAPALMDKKIFSQNIYNISSEDLGRVVHILDQRCDACIKKIDPEDIEIDVDAIDAASFWTVDAFVKDCLPGAKRAPGAQKKAGGGGGAGASAAAAAAPDSSKSKKARLA